MKNTDLIYEESPEELEAQKLERKKKAKRKRIMSRIDKVFGVFLATGIMAGIAGLALEYVIVKGPSPSLRDKFVMTMMETRRFGFVNNVYLTEDEIREIRESRNVKEKANFDNTLVSISSDPGAVQTEDIPDYGLVDEDGDGIIFEEIKGSGYAGYMITVLDPKRMFVGMPNDYGGIGLTLEEMCKKYDAIGGINAGGFLDESGTGLGGLPAGLTIVDGVCYNNSYDMFCGFDDEGLFYVGYFDYHAAEVNNIKNGVSFGPLLVLNGEAANPSALSSGVNPRTAIGQRADGAVLLLVIDGRQMHSVGATYQDCVDIMLDHGAVNAINMDGGSSTCMYYNGEYVNSCSATYGPRPLPTAFLFK